ncbi:type VII secretion protein EccE [Streptomyces sp. DSM 44915]|uniref:Type VII secretion protein EccE n=1 Tax=Streptomyces chisholmiae TaxID=3075540 RepID=A0ABU2JMM8_9ACTN|nr:type VII secretion protein EccE [Streptomyces sp. DSM 44915]MDT0266246.1 type VII secretion protein EccE [Streptomyces sp. DSM 44915]
MSVRLPGRGRLVALQAGLGCAATGIALASPWGYALAGGGAAVLAGALLRVRGQWADQRLLAGLSRGTLATAAEPPAPAEPLGLAHTVLPALDITEVPDRNGPPLGVLADGRGHAAALACPSGALPSLPVGLFADFLAEDPARPAAVQLLVERFAPPPWDQQHRYQPTIAYRQLPTGGGPTALRTVLLVRYEPLRAPAAARRRGGGAAGAGAAVAAATARLRARLAARGVAATPLGAAELAALLRETGDPDGRGEPLPGLWSGELATHCLATARVPDQAAWTRLLATLSGCATDRALACATVTGGAAGSAGAEVRVAVRLVSALPQLAIAERARLVAAGVLDAEPPESYSGLLATLPVACPGQPLTEATGLLPTQGAAR